ncbi:hypothetical protein Taro_036720 [Colocasia esculenta]|uniref:Uncharacterized protein n=1 Tax=Colocasia esculenta TaxID=4460 RepID=A0A843W2A4_COLES|nr:hypothetical protein [Colocasia esculenta]
MCAACRAWSGAADVWSVKATPEAVAIRFSTRSRRGDVARSGGNAAPCLDCVFFMKLVCGDGAMKVEYEPSPSM